MLFRGKQIHHRSAHLYRCWRGSSLVLEHSRQFKMSLDGILSVYLTKPLRHQGN